MTERRWSQVRELFLDLADLPEEDRRTELAQLEQEDPDLARRVKRLLVQDDGLPGAPEQDRPARFGPYETVQRIGRGGMGEVFLARRADGEYDHEVAVKLLRGGATNHELVARFLRERQALARLDHEYIARLLDGGTTDDGEPYLVMEYVDGEPADVFAARLALRERLELFVRIGRAVTHAHERGFVHRDLKPSNILVRPDGTPRLLDFGIARLDPETHTERAGEEPLTRTGNLLFTPGYASPEQVLGQPVTAQSDIFALGVVLYELLCGESPWPRSGHEAFAFAIRDDDPTPPSRRVTGTARGRISGDLDAIVLQCLAKRPERRYVSVAELSADIERHLAGLPIRARRTGAVGRAVRLVRRRPLIPVGGVLLLVASAAVVFAWDSERRSRRHETELLSSVADRIDASQTLWSDGDSEGANAELDAALDALGELPGETELEAEVLLQKAVLANLASEHERALELMERARPLLDELETPNMVLRATLLNSYAFAIQSTSPGDRSLEAARVALQFARENVEPGHVLYGDALLGWADELNRAGRTDDALEAFEQAVTEMRQRTPKSEELSRLLNEQAISLSRSGRYDEAIAAYEESLGILSWNHGARHPSFPKVRLNLGTTYFRQGRFEEAKEHYEQALDGARRSNLEVHAAVSLHYLGCIWSDEGDQEAAEEAALEAIATCERLGITVHAKRSRCLLGVVMARTDRPDEARAVLAPLLAETDLGWLRADLEADGRHALGRILYEAGEDERARPHLERALELKRERLGPTHSETRELAELLADE